MDAFSSPKLCNTAMKLLFSVTDTDWNQRWHVRTRRTKQDRTELSIVLYQWVVGKEGVYSLCDKLIWHTHQSLQMCVVCEYRGL